MKRAFIAAALAVAISPALANAHVVVRPAEAGVAKFQTFTVSVPNEKDVPTVGVRLVLPAGLDHVTPNVKSGWRIEVKKEKTGETATLEDGTVVEEERVSEISWTGGSIPVGQRDEFYFSAQLPAEEARLAWKAYQAYQGGTVVAWDQEGGHNEDAEFSENTGPYSETAVIDDLSSDDERAGGKVSIELALSLIALVVAAAAYMRAGRTA